MNNYTVFLDLDGVIVDWLGPTMKLAGLNPTDASTRNAVRDNPPIVDRMIGHERLIELLEKAGSDFWVNLPLLPWADLLIDSLNKALPDQICFLTSPGNWSSAASGKMIWQEKNYPDIPILIGTHKQLAASDLKFLIDDDPNQYSRFIQMGGQGWLWPNQYVLEDLGSERCEDMIKNMLLHITQQKTKALLNRQSTNWTM